MVGLPGFFKRKPKDKIGSRHTYGITALGKTKSDAFSLHGPKWDVLAHLDENGPSSVGEISEGTQLNPKKVKAIIRDLIGSGYVIRSSSHDD